MSGGHSADEIDDNAQRMKIGGADHRRMSSVSMVGGLESLDSLAQDPPKIAT